MFKSKFSSAQTKRLRMWKTFLLQKLKKTIIVLCETLHLRIMISWCIHKCTSQMFIWCLLCARHCSKHGTNITLFNPHTNPLKTVLLLSLPLIRKQRHRAQLSSNLTNISCLVSGCPGIWTPAVSSQSPFSQLLSYATSPAYNNNFKMFLEYADVIHGVQIINKIF